jgi:hypothetical protein
VTVILPQFAACFKLLFRHTTEVIKNTLDPVWRPFSLKSSQLAASPDTNFRINVIDWDAVGSHDPIGHIIVTPKVLFFMRIGFYSKCSMHCMFIHYRRCLFKPLLCGSCRPFTLTVTLFTALCRGHTRQRVSQTHALQGVPICRGLSQTTALSDVQVVAHNTLLGQIQRRRSPRTRRLHCAGCASLY